MLSQLNTKEFLVAIIKPISSALKAKQRPSPKEKQVLVKPRDVLKMPLHPLIKLIADN